MDPFIKKNSFSELVLYLKCFKLNFFVKYSIIIIDILHILPNNRPYLKEVINSWLTDGEIILVFMHQH